MKKKKFPTHSEVHEREFCFPVLGLLVLVRLARALLHPLRVAVSPHVHLGERTHVPDPGHLHREVTQEVDDLQGLVADTADEHERGEDGTEELLH